MNIRNATKNDITKIVEIYKQCFPQYIEYAEYEVSAIINTNCGYILEKDNEIISFMGCVKKSSNGLNIGLIVAVMTKPE